MKTTVEFDVSGMLTPEKEYEPLFLVLDGTRIGEKIPIAEGVSYAGRHPECQMQIEASMISGRHLAVKRSGQKVSVADLNSTNGSVLSGTKLEPRRMYPLEDGAVLILGNVILKYFASKAFEMGFFDRLVQKTIIDSLTEVNNKRYLLDHGASEFDRATRFKRKLSLAMLDLDHFKKVNDTFGHQVGDFVLQKLAAIIKGSIRKQDLFARYGGEEFVILFVEAGLNEAYEVVERVRKAVADLEFKVGDAVAMVTISIVLAAMSPRSKTFEELVDIADKAMYRAKNAGRNQTQCSI